MDGLTKKSEEGGLTEREGGGENEINHMINHTHKHKLTQIKDK